MLLTQRGICHEQPEVNQTLLTLTDMHKNALCLIDYGNAKM